MEKRTGFAAVHYAAAAAAAAGLVVAGTGGAAAAALAVAHIESGATVLARMVQQLARMPPN